jgi:hypothetical protein
LVINPPKPTRGPRCTFKTTAIYAMSSALEMHAAELKVSAKISSVKSKNNVMKGTMIIMVLTTTNLTRSGHRKRDTSQESSRHILQTLSGSDGQLTSRHQGSRNTMDLPIRVSGSKYISSPSRLPEGTHTSWQIFCQSVCHHLSGPGSSGYPRGRFDIGTTCVGCSPATSVPPAHDRESTAT